MISQWSHCTYRWAGRMLSVLICLIYIGQPVSFGAEKANGKAVGTLTTADGTILARSNPEAKWKAIEKNGSIQAGDLLVGIPGAEVQSQNGAVTIRFLTDFAENSPFPVVEAAARIQASSKYDLDITLDRGRIHLINSKKKGAAKVHFRFYDEAWDLTLEEPGTEAALEYFGRWPLGSRFVPNPPKGTKSEPLLGLAVLAIKGSIVRSCPSCEYAMSAPPGPALYMWDNVTGKDNRVQRLNKLPEWAKKVDPSTPDIKERKAALERFRKLILEKGVEDAVKGLISSDNAKDRRLGIIAAGATDQLKLVGDALLAGKHADLWENAVLTLRHWLGRAPGQDQKLYQGLLEERKISAIQAQTAIRLLHGFTEIQAARPELYEILIDYLQHDTLAIRGLANWHLQRLVPHVDIAFNPVGSKEEHKIARDKWKKLIPDGKLPPPPKVDKTGTEG